MAEGKKIAKDTYLFRENDAPDAMYIIKSGSLAITKSKGNSEVVLAEIGPGAMVGEMAIFDKKPRSANVKAMKDSEVICLPYESLDAQLESLPVWIRAILRTMNENLRDANKKIKALENPANDQDRFPAHIINRLLSIVSFIGLKFGQKEGENLIVPANTLRNYTIQIFGEATNKMQSMLMALQGLGYMKVEDLGEGRQKITNYKPDFLFDFVSWYNDWIYKQEKDKVLIKEEEVKILNGVLHFAKNAEIDKKGQKKVSLNTIQNESMKELGFLIKQEDLNPLIEKGIVSEKIMEANGVFVTLKLEDLELPAQYWNFLYTLKKALR